MIEFSKARTSGFFFASLVAVASLIPSGCSKPNPSGKGWRYAGGKSVSLSAPQKSGGMPLNESLATRRSQREFSEKKLTEAQISQLCWSAQGLSSESGKRTAPSAGALYPVTVLFADHQGVREYRPESHSLISRGEKDVRNELQAAALDQKSVGNAPVCFIIAFDVSRTAKKYGKRAERYCLLETGHVAQNLLLTVTSLRLAAVSVGALDEERVSSILGLPDRLQPAYLIPVGHPQ